MTAEEVGPVTKPVSRIWMWVLGFLCVGFLGHAAFKPTFEGNFAYGVGFYLLPALLVSGGFWALSPSARRVRWRVFGIIYGSFLVGHFVGMQAQQQQAIEFAGNIKQVMTDFASQTSSDSTGPIAIRPATSNLSGYMGVAEVTMKSLMNEAATVHNEYMKALEQAGWMTLLDPARVKRDKGLVESRAIVANATAVVERYRPKAIGVYDTMQQKAALAAFRSDSFRREFLDGVNKGVATGKKNTVASWDYEARILKEYGAVVELLARREGHFEIAADNQVVFEADADAD